MDISLIWFKLWALKFELAIHNDRLFRTDLTQNAEGLLSRVITLERQRCISTRTIASQN